MTKHKGIVSTAAVIISFYISSFFTLISFPDSIGQIINNDSRTIEYVYYPILRTSIAFEPVNNVLECTLKFSEDKNYFESLQQVIVFEIALSELDFSPKHYPRIRDVEELELPEISSK